MAANPDITESFYPAMFVECEDAQWHAVHLMNGMKERGTTWHRVSVHRVTGAIWIEGWYERPAIEAWPPWAS